MSHDGLFGARGFISPSTPVRVRLAPATCALKAAIPPDVEV
jgi:hypothetical protein